MEGPILRDVCSRNQGKVLNLIDVFAFEIRQNFLIAKIGCFLNHQLIREEDRVRYSQYEHPDASVFVFYFESVF